MPRVNLSLDQHLFNELDQLAKRNQISINLVILKILEGICYNNQSINTVQALKEIIEETEKLEDGEKFQLRDLESYNKYTVATGVLGRVQPSTIRGRLSKEFNKAIDTGRITHIKQIKVMDKNGNRVAKKLGGASVYVVDRGNSATNNE